jgi:hypothetical protein
LKRLLKENQPHPVGSPLNGAKLLIPFFGSLTITLMAALIAVKHRGDQTILFQKVDLVERSQVLALCSSTCRKTVMRHEQFFNADGETAYAN